MKSKELTRTQLLQIVSVIGLILGVIDIALSIYAQRAINWAVGISMIYFLYVLFDVNTTAAEKKIAEEEGYDLKKMAQKLKNGSTK